MYNFEDSKKREKVIRLQLAPLIDVFVLIIVFLLKGTIMEVTAIERPPDVNLAQSVSSEQSEVAPQVIISVDNVTFKMVNENRPTRSFSSDEINVRDSIIEKLKKYITENKDVEGALNINVISDQSISYKIVYNVVSLLRISGFQYMLMVAEGEGSE